MFGCLLEFVGLPTEEAEAARGTRRQLAGLSDQRIWVLRHCEIYERRLLDKNITKEVRYQAFYENEPDTMMHMISQYSLSQSNVPMSFHRVLTLEYIVEFSIMLM